MSHDSFYQDHWINIEAERLARYEEMFAFREHQEPLIAPLELEPGHSVADYGCGPAFMAMEFARRVGPGGKVYGFDVNQDFVQRASQRIREAHLENVELFRIISEHTPLEDEAVDRLFCKNVLEYVPDLDATLKEQFRILKSGGLIQIVDSDWDFVVVEPWDPDTTRRFFAAAAPAFNEPNIGRKLYSAMRRTGFSEVNVNISAAIDTTGRSRSVLTNMASYIRTFETLPDDEVAGLMAKLDAATIDKSYLFVLPQFIVTARK